MSVKIVKNDEVKLQVKQEEIPFPSIEVVHMILRGSLSLHFILAMVQYTYYI